MTDTQNRRLLGLSCVTQLITFAVFTSVQYLSGNGFCLKSQDCIKTSIKFFLFSSFVCIILGWLASGAFVFVNGSDACKSRKRKIYCFLKSMCITFFGSFVFHFITILYGAPFIQNMEETYLFSCCMSMMTLFNLMLVSSGKWWTIIQIINFELYRSGKVIDCVRLISFLAILGALIGSAAIPLDWDRPWQVWPVPCCVGAAVGYFIGLLIFIFVPLVEYVKLKHEGSKMKYY